MSCENKESCLVTSSQHFSITYSSHRQQIWLCIYVHVVHQQVDVTPYLLPSLGIPVAGCLPSGCPFFPLWNAKLGSQIRKSLAGQPEFRWKAYLILGDGDLRYRYCTYGTVLMVLCILYGIHAHPTASLVVWYRYGSRYQQLRLITRRVITQKIRYIWYLPYQYRTGKLLGFK